MLRTFVEKTPDIAGKAIWMSGRTALIQQMKKAIGIGQRAGADPAKLNRIWRDVQSGYLSELLPRTVEEFSTASIFKLQKNPGLRRTMNRMFTSTQKEVLIENMEIMALIGRAGSRGNLNLRQIDAASRLIQSTLILGGTVSGAANQGFLAGFALTGGLTFLLAPAVASRYMTKKGFVKALAAFDKSDLTGGTGVVAGTKFIKALALFEQQLTDEGVSVKGMVEEAMKQLKENEVRAAEKAKDFIPQSFQNP